MQDRGVAQGLTERVRIYCNAEKQAHSQGVELPWRKIGQFSQIGGANRYCGSFLFVPHFLHLPAETLQTVTAMTVQLLFSRQCQFEQDERHAQSGAETHYEGRAQFVALDPPA